MGFLDNGWEEIMHKGKSPSSPSSRLLPKKWRFKSSSPKLSPSAASTLWSHEGNCRWTSMSGRTAQLTKTLLLYLSEMERATLQKVALQCLQEFDLGPFAVPKDGSMKRSKKSNFSFKGKSKNSSFLDNLKDNFKDIGKENKDPGNTTFVFGIPLSKCIANDIALQRRRSSQRKERRESLDLANTTYRIKQPGKGANGKTGGSSSVNGSGKDISKRQTLPSESSQSESEKSGPNASLLEALSLSTSSSDCHRKEKRKALAPREPQVPHVVTACFKYIDNHGLRVLGIFRVGGSKKRIKQLREEFDSGNDVKFHDSYNAHDVAALLKEYFRDLPEPLMSRDLYPAFIATTNIEDIERRVKVLHYLVCLLPIVHVDTLYALMKFLHKVSCYAKDSIDENGEELPGNKMDTHNLATLFGPNLLHKLKPVKDKDFHCDGSQESVEESREVIEVVQSMIEHHEEIFQVSAEDHNELMKRLLENDPEALDYILNRISAVQMGYRPSTSESSVFDGSDLSSAPHTPTGDSDPFRPRVTSEGIPHHINSNHSGHGSPASPPKGLTGVSLAHHQAKSVSFSGEEEAQPSSQEPQLQPQQPQPAMQTAAMGMKKKKQPPPRLNLSQTPKSPPAYTSPVVFYTPPVSPTALPSYQEHMIRKKVASPVLGRTASNSNPVNSASTAGVLSSPLRSSTPVMSPTAASSVSNYPKSPTLDPWETLYVNRTVTNKGSNSTTKEVRTELDSGTGSVKSPQKTTKESTSNECQKEKWLQWQKVASENSSGDMYEQETLV
ncbi:rho GTPase-activating protein 6-like isoform X2 [Ptychodera flava]|uniref:rho GTPase-activating protein 6-like isoform X2 n=1 Tax=Ptychodera flava TaxID=63121 RepID=UPI00396A9A1E